MTLKLYDTDAYLKECISTVEKCEKCSEGYKIYLNQTIFFARGGGQPGDKGTIDGLTLLDVYEDKSGFVHLLESPVEVGKSVKCVLDFDFRFDSMQQHMGQHIFSRVAEITYGAHTVAARIEEGVSHVELDKKLDYQQMFDLQARVNDVINKALPVTIGLYTQEEAKKLGLPAKAFTHEIIRVVTIEGLDVNPCGGTHPRSTKEVEKCVITGTKEVRGVHRIYYKFGKRALNNRFDVLSALLDLQSFFDVQDKSELMPAVTALKEKAERLAGELSSIKAELCQSDCNNLLNMGLEKDLHKLIIAHFEEKNYIKQAVDKAVLENSCAVMLTNKQGETLNLVLAQTKALNKYNMGAIVREFLQKFPGKGGGGNVVAQCSVPYSADALEYAKTLFNSNITE